MIKKLFVYDSDCGLCKMFMKWTKKFPSLIKKIQFMPFLIFNAEHSKIYDLESDEQLKNSLLICTNREESGQINTKIYRGAASINGILRSIYDLFDYDATTNLVDQHINVEESGRLFIWALLNVGEIFNSSDLSVERQRESY